MADPETVTPEVVESETGLTEAQVELVKEVGGEVQELPKKKPGRKSGFDFTERFNKRQEITEKRGKFKGKPGNPAWHKGMKSPYIHTKRKAELKEKIKAAGPDFSMRCKVWMSAEGWKRITDIAKDKNHPRHFDALKLLIEYGYGKPLQTMALGVTPVQLKETVQERIKDALSAVRGGLVKQLPPCSGGVEQPALPGGLSGGSTGDTAN